MPNRRLSMRQILETLQLREQFGFSNRQIADVIKVSPTTVAGYIRRAEVAGVDYATAVTLGHDALEHRLFPAQIHSAIKRPAPNWAHIHTELNRENTSRWICCGESTSNGTLMAWITALSANTTASGPRRCT